MKEHFRMFFQIMYVAAPPPRYNCHENKNNRVLNDDCEKHLLFQGVEHSNVFRKVSRFNNGAAGGRADKTYRSYVRCTGNKTKKKKHNNQKRKTYPKKHGHVLLKNKPNANFNGTFYRANCCAQARDINGFSQKNMTFTNRGARFVTIPK